ncbi:hypothetical protein EX30DRAFT_171267 [Ascodesmis nigricans]|uniref:Uncharacterized protein n=1 Tax=Ascodesmis nigricans TaxID=341454 RepID=A0A4S2MLY0_9PEZI|nr:hypothetical protein EX30DRAFT_171267 [Ascodesmis nigricans]
MMAASAPGPIPVPVAQQSIPHPQNMTMRTGGGGHQRQPSSTTRATAGRPSTSAGAGSRAPDPSSVLSSTTQYRPGGGAATQSSQQPRVQIVTGGRPTTHGPQASTTTPAGTQRSPARGTTTRQPNPATARPSTTERESGAAAPSNSAAGNPTANTTTESQVRNSFPHAFERWEMLSSRWEGLTGYWVSRLEGNRQELSHLPLEQEMSRQITDLAAAGANLFQALIELQRLRASSERKFQRWFIETRGDHERFKEECSELRRTLQAERERHKQDLQAQKQSAVDTEKLVSDKEKAEKLAQEAQRELQISKEECRRAWEELGRREQEERERITQLREGHPTLIGGVQVIAMPMPGVPSRAASSATRPRTATGAGTTTSSAFATEQDYAEQQAASQVGSTQSRSRQQTDYGSTTPTGAASPSSSFYQQQPANIHDRLDPRGSTAQANASPVSYITNPMGSPTISAVSGVSDAFQTDEHGNVMTDGKGNPLYAQRSRRHQESDRRQQQQQRMDEEEERQWGNYPSYEGEDWDAAGSGRISDGPEAASAGASGYGRQEGDGGVLVSDTPSTWGSHHHPTRLSNIEEERETASEIGTR